MGQASLGVAVDVVVDEDRQVGGQRVVWCARAIEELTFTFDADYYRLGQHSQLEDNVCATMVEVAMLLVVGCWLRAGVQKKTKNLDAEEWKRVRVILPLHDNDNVITKVCFLLLVLSCVLVNASSSSSPSYQLTHALS